MIIFLSRKELNEGDWLVEFSSMWIPRYGVGIHLALDGLSLLMLMLTFFIGIPAVLVSWKEISMKTGFFHFNILLILAGITGVFLATDLFLFYFFWEVMLIPMYFLIGIWRHENRVYASYKFFIFTQASGLLMLLSILALYLIHGKSTGVYTFDYELLLGTRMSPSMALLIMLGFLAAFLVKLPVFPLHTWLPDAHTEAPTAGSLILASLMLKTGAYGVIRFAIPLFPSASAVFAPVGMILGVTGILYGTKLTFAQTDLKRLVAYTSVSHMGFIAVLGACILVISVLSSDSRDADMVSDVGGLFWSNPLMAAVLSISLLSLAGLPLTAGFHVPDLHV